MKIAYLINQYPHTTHTFIRREINALEKQGFQIERFALRADIQNLVDPQDIDEYQLTTKISQTRAHSALFIVARCLLTQPIRFLKALIISLTMGWRANSLLKHFLYFIEACVFKTLSEKSSCAHTHAHFGTNATTVALLSHMLGGVKYSFTVHGPEEFDRPNELSLGLKICHAKFVIGVSNFGKSQLYRWARYKDWAKLHVIRCSIDPREFNETEHHTEPRSGIVSVGRLAEQKGYFILIDALAQLKSESGRCPDVSIIGDGPLKPALLRRIKELGLEAEVSVLGWLPQTEVKRAIRLAKLFVLPSFAEGLPVVFMESFALSTPVVSTYIAGIPELVIHNENGWLVPAGDSQSLSSILNIALDTSETKLAKMGALAKEHVHTKHNLDLETKKLAKLFSSDGKLSN